MTGIGTHIFTIASPALYHLAIPLSHQDFKTQVMVLMVAVVWSIPPIRITLRCHLRVTVTVTCYTLHLRNDVVKVLLTDC